MIITKQLVEKLSDENITKKEYDQIVEAISIKTKTVNLMTRFINIMKVFQPDFYGKKIMKKKFTNILNIVKNTK